MQIAWHESLKFGQLTLGKIIKIVTIRCQILRLKCTKFNSGWGCAPDPAGGAYSASPDPLAGLWGPTSKGGDRKGKGGEGTGRGEPRGEEGMLGCCGSASASRCVCSPYICDSDTLPPTQPGQLNSRAITCRPTSASHLLG